MKFEDLGIDTMKKVFDFYLPHKDKKTGEYDKFDTRELATFKNTKADGVTGEQIYQQDVEYISEVALIYLKTFYGKSPKDFKTPEYKAECIRLKAVIENSQNSELLKKNIEKFIADGKIDYINIYQDPLYENVFFNGINELGLNTDDPTPGHKIFVTPDYRTVARVYVNPSSMYYKDLLVFLTKKIAEEELCAGAKTRLGQVGTATTMDTLIIYTSAEDFARVVEVLEEFGELYPEKVATFGPTLECTAKTEQGWFGAGYDPQLPAAAPNGVFTYNDEINWIFNDYILPSCILNDLVDIFSLLSPSEQLLVVRDLCSSDTQAREVLKALKDPKTLEEFLSKFCDLSYITETSNNRIKEMSKDPSKLNGQSPERTILNKGDTEVKLMVRQEIPLVYNGKTILNETRDVYSRKLLLNPIFRQALLHYYNTQEKIDKEAQEMLTLWKYIGRALPYLDDENPCLSVDMSKSLNKKYSKAKEHVPMSQLMQQLLAEQDINPKLDIAHKIDETQKEQIDVIEALCGKTYFLKQKLQQVIKEKDIKNVPDYSKFSREELEQLLIKLVGLDNVIDASLYVKNNTKKGERINHKYENNLQSIRTSRGLQVLEALKKITNKATRERYINSLSLYEKEDLITAASLQDNMDFISDVVAVSEW